MRFFDIFLFHEWNPSGPLINSLKWFCLKISFHGDIRKKIDSTQAITARSQQLNLKIQKCIILPLQASPCLEYICELLQHSPTFFVSLLKG